MNHHPVTDSVITRNRMRKCASDDKLIINVITWWVIRLLIGCLIYVMLCTHECLWVSILWLSPKLNVRVLEMIYNFLGENITIIIIQNYGTKIMEAKNFDSKKFKLTYWKILWKITGEYRKNLVPRKSHLFEFSDI